MYAFTRTFFFSSATRFEVEALLMSFAFITLFAGSESSRAPSVVKSSTGPLKMVVLAIRRDVPENRSATGMFAAAANGTVSASRSTTSSG
jgi:hypothetical protein